MSDEIREYDENGNLIHHKDSDGVEKWLGYDQNVKIVHYGTLIHTKLDNGYEEWYEFEHGKCIHYKNSQGKEEWYD